MRRFGFVARLVIIVLLALFGVVAIGAGLRYVENVQFGLGSRGLLPRQIAALVTLLEASPVDEWQLILDAARAPSLQLDIAASFDAPRATTQSFPGLVWFLRRRVPDGDTRRIEVTMAGTGEATVDRRGAAFAYSRAPLLIQVSLANGEVLTLRATGESRRIFGLPPGFWLGIFGSLIALVAVLAVLREARPLRRLEAAVASFAATAEPQEIRAEGAKDIRALGAAISDMEQRIHTLLTGRTMLIGAISHDLKTFITRLRLRVEAIEDDLARGKAIADLDDMTALIDGAVTFARSAAASNRREPVDLAVLLVDEIAGRDGDRVTLTAPADPSTATVDGDPLALRRLFANLIDNALRYGSACRVSVQTEGDSAIVAVEDDGPGIPTADRALVFEPFYRADTSRSRETGGSGLGLAIAKQIVLSHGGAIALSGSEMGGARFTVTLPVSVS